MYVARSHRHDGQYFALSVLLVITDQFSTETAQ
jgi:hypothetical protein